MEIVFGHEVKSIDDVFLQVASKGGRTIAAAGAVGAHIVDLIPPCTFPILGCRQRILYDLSVPQVRFIPDWFPGAGFKRLPPGTREALAAMRDVPFNDVKRRMVSASRKLRIIFPHCPKGGRDCSSLLYLGLA